MPILLGKFDAPEMRARAEELDADARTLFGGVAEVDDPAFLLFIGRGIDENQLGANFERLVEIEQAAMSVDYNRLALRAEFPAFDVLSGRMDRNAREDAGASALFRDLRSWHRHSYRAMGHWASQLRQRKACSKEQMPKVVEFPAGCVVCEQYPAAEYPCPRRGPTYGARS